MRDEKKQGSVIQTQKKEQAWGSSAVSLNKENEIRNQ